MPVLTIEQTVNKYAKTKGGIVGFSKNMPAYFRWSANRHQRLQYVAALRMMANKEDTCDQHKELSSAQKKLSEASACKAI